MPWFVPTQGDLLFLGVEASSLSEIETMNQRLSALTGRVHRMSRGEWEARAVGRDLAEIGALSEAPENLGQLKTAILDDTAFAEFAMTAGIESPYRKARPQEIKDLEDFPLAMWPLRLHEGGMT